MLIVRMYNARMSENKWKKVKVILCVLFVLTVIIAVVHLTYTISFNEKEHVVLSGDETSESYMKAGGRGDSTSMWKKRDFDYYGDTVDLTAQTIDFTFCNESDDLISSWSLVINIHGDCFINNAWCGVMEIHQNVGTDKEKEQTLDLRNYRLEAVKLDYLYDGDLLIPLKEGDYIRYAPSKKDREMPIDGNSELTVGAIFYYLDDLDLSDYQIEFYYHRSFFEGIGFFASVSLFFVCCIIFCMYEVAKYSYKKAWNEMETQGRIDRAEAENKAKSVFLANMSHEIRTPINTVLGLDTMILRESSEEHIRTYAKEIKSAGQMLLSLINGILDSSKLEAGRMELVPADYSLKQMLFDVHVITKAIIDAKHLEYIVEVNPDIPDKLYGDDVRIKQIIINLLTNAAKYTESGSVTLGVDGKEEGGRLMLRVSVKDTGMGIKEEDLKKLAERFTRLDEKRNRNIEGTGLGMSLVKGLLELMDSELSISSTYGEGSEFRFEIAQDIVESAPVGEIDFEHMELEDEDSYKASFTAPNADILVVDDNPMNLVVFENLLKETKVKIDKAGSGKEALELTKNKKYDIVFMDHMMPEMDGIECFHHIREQADGKNNDTPVIILTANALQGAREEYLAEGFTDFLKKPIEPGELEAKVSENLSPDKLEKASTDGGAKKQSGESDKMPQIEGVDIAYAISHVGDAKSALKVMEQFTTVAEADANELLGYFDALKNDNNDSDALKSFRIKVHSMKSSAGLFGALQVYGVAAFLEIAARDGNVERIIEVTPHFIDFWLQLRTALDNFFNEGKIKEENTLGLKDVQELLHQLETSMNAYDVKSADQLLLKLSGYDFGADKEVHFNELKLAVSQLDALKVTDLCEKLK